MPLLRQKGVHQDSENIDGVDRHGHPRIVIRLSQLLNQLTRGQVQSCKNEPFGAGLSAVDKHLHIHRDRLCENVVFYADQNLVQFTYSADTMAAHCLMPRVSV